MRRLCPYGAEDEIRGTELGNAWKAKIATKALKTRNVMAEALWVVEENIMFLNV